MENNKLQNAITNFGLENESTRKTREVAVANQWAEYYINRGQDVTSAQANERRKEKDGFYPYFVAVNLKDCKQYYFQYYSK